jgi:hypothetical protein
MEMIRRSPAYSREKKKRNAILWSICELSGNILVLGECGRFEVPVPHDPIPAPHFGWLVRCRATESRTTLHQAATAVAAR